MRMVRPRGCKMLRRTAAGCFILVAAIVGVVLLARALPEIHRVTATLEPTDGRVDWIGARAFLDGRNPYAPEQLRASGLALIGGFGHPPTTPFWFLPLARMPVQMMSIALAFIVTLLLAWQILIICLQLRAPLPLATAWLALCVVLSRDWTIESFHAAQVSPVIAFFYVAAWYFLRRGENVEAGALLGFACSMKLFPGVLVLLLLRARNWRAVAASIVAFLGIAGLMTSRYGLTAWPMFFAQQRGVADRWMGNIHNASIHGIVLRMFHPSCGTDSSVVPGAVVISSLASLGLIAAGWWLVDGAPDDLRGEALDLPYALFALLSIFTSQWVWDHYNVLLLLPLAVLPRALAHASRTGMPRIASALGHLGLGSAALLLVTVDRWTKFRLQDQYMRDRSVHLQLHLFEVLNWLPTVLLLAVTATLLCWRKVTTSAPRQDRGRARVHQGVRGTAVSANKSP